VRPDEAMWLARCRVESIAKRLSRCGGLAIFLFRRASSTLAQAYRADEDRTGAQSPFPTFERATRPRLCGNGEWIGHTGPEEN
jgi:hypothetical protein